jgi:cytochrome c oxidase subunit 2
VKAVPGCRDGSNCAVPFRTEFDHTLLFESVLAGAVFVTVGGLLAFALLRYRAAGRASASQETEHPRLEAGFAAALLVIALGIVFATRGAMAADNRVPSNIGVTVRVTGYQWCWRFDYSGTPVTVTASCLTGHYPTLVVPSSEPVRIETTSQDVIHSFWIPAFRFKMDAFPRHVSSFVITAPHPGVWLGHCAEFCGEDHAFMAFHFKALPAAAFRSWLTAREAGAVGASG